MTTPISLIDDIQSRLAELRVLVSTPTPEPPKPEPPKPVIRQPSGYFVMQEVGAQNVSDRKLDSDNLTGLVIREHWENMNPKQGEFRWDFIDQQLARCEKFGKKAILAIYTGSSAPTWIGGEWFGPQGKEAPYPWSSAMLAAHPGMVASLAARYAKSPLVVGVEIGGPTCPERSLEMHPSNGVDKLLGYSEYRFLAAWKECGSQYAENFRECAVISDGGPFPAGGKAHVTTAFWDYMHRNYREQFNVSHCSLKADTPEDALHHKIVVDYAKAGGRIGFEMVGPSRGGNDGEKGPVSRFGGEFSTALALAEKAGAKWIKCYQSDVSSAKPLSTF